MKTLNEQQIDELYIFTRQHFVEHFDLQTELVDHMAHGIEAQWARNEQLTFEQARDLEFKKFGVFGFMEVVEKRQAALGKKYMRIIWTHFKQYMRLPRVLGFIAIILGFYYLLAINHEYTHEIIMSLLGIFVVTYIGLLFYQKRQLKKSQQQTGKKWLFKEIIFTNGAGWGFFVIPTHLFNVFIIGGHDGYSNWVLFIFSIVLCSMVLMFYIMCFEITTRADEYLEETYPEYKLV
ncbi:hypothetical protein [Nonlabens ponticola]|uniref:Uncharacterized protein n=1 Tax=Nonlabens ponticola TaxID=2496866 RepID=A0A3S9MYS4_9FLAO|nr:hypothetical protein [Nonlabens ponticola]AZQ44308.1 hypothetical protein EJ995_08690 [Nonlabens ponticola]